MRRLIVLVTTLLCLLAPVSASAAFDPLANACGSAAGLKSSAACDASKNDPISGPNGILMKASLVIATLGGIAAVIIIIVAGFRFVTANGDASKVSGARSAIIGSIIGLVIIAAAESIVILVVKKL
jgi:hypothetical protein